MFNRLSRKAVKAVDTAPMSEARLARTARSLPVAPTILLATGAGVAFWYWTQWSRGRAESDAAGAKTLGADER